MLINNNNNNNNNNHLSTLAQQIIEWSNKVCRNRDRRRHSPGTGDHRQSLELPQGVGRPHLLHEQRHDVAVAARVASRHLQQVSSTCTSSRRSLRFARSSYRVVSCLHCIHAMLTSSCICIYFYNHYGDIVIVTDGSH